MSRASRDTKKRERLLRRAAKLQWSRRPTLLGRLASFMGGGGAALIVFLALWFLFISGREGLSAEPPRVGVDRPVGD